MRVRGVLKIIVAFVATSCLWIAGVSNAQTGQPIVLECTPEGTGRLAATLDLTRKTTLEQITDSGGQFFFEGTVTQITDQQIVWVWNERTTVTTTHTLNRYTLRLSSVQMFNSNGHAVYAQYACQRVQKQF